MLNRRQFLIAAAAVAAGATGCSRIGIGPKPQPSTEQAPPPVDDGPRPAFRVALLSDPHTMETNGAANVKLAEAGADFAAYRPDLWLVCGDIATDGLASQHEAFKKIMARVVKPENLLVTTGNHDFYDREATDEAEIKRFCTAFGLKTPYSSRVAGGLHFVMLADEQYKTAPGNREGAWLTPEQMRWFEGVLQEHRDKVTVVCLHAPLQETIVWSGSPDTASANQGKALRAILQKNPQVRLFLSGHTHMSVEIEGNVLKQNGVTFVGLGSTYYQFRRGDAMDPRFGPYKQDFSLSQSRMLDVWPDRLVVRARDHVSKAWLPTYELTIKRA